MVKYMQIRLHNTLHFNRFYDAFTDPESIFTYFIRIQFFGKK